MRLRPRQLMPLLAALGCAFDGSTAGTSFRCEPPANRCPAGQVCAGGFCTSGTAVDAAGSGDAAAADAAPLGVCERAALAPDNDTCAAAIDLTAAASTPAGTTVYGDTTGYAGNLNPSIIVGCTESPEPGPDAVYRIDAQAGEVVHVTLALEDWDGAVYLLDDCTGGAQCLGGSDEIATGNLETADLTVATTGPHYLVVDASVAASAGCYTLEVRLE